MKFRYIGTPKNITDLRSIASKHKQLERKNVKIAIVDNESFPMIEILHKTHRERGGTHRGDGRLCGDARRGEAG